jgi:hypothetical protein
MASLECEPCHIMHSDCKCGWSKASVRMARRTIARFGPPGKLPGMGISVATRATRIPIDTYRCRSRAAHLPVTLHAFHRSMLSPEGKTRRRMVELLHGPFTPPAFHVTSFAACLGLSCCELTIVRIGVAIGTHLEFHKPERAAGATCSAAHMARHTLPARMEPTQRESCRRMVESRIRLFPSRG